MDIHIERQFQSAPHFSSEANIILAGVIAYFNLFQSAPHFSSEANPNVKYLLLCHYCFNPRLTSAARRTSD